MTELKLYYPDGKKTFESEEEFVNFYEQVYFYANGNIKLEKMMDDIRNKSALKLDDYGNILAWKTGGEYDEDKKTVSYQYGEIDLKQFEDFEGEKEKQRKDGPIELLHKLIKCEKIGFVYGITLMYFISKGEYPIYDRFAHYALLAIGNNIAPGKEIIKKRELINVQIGSSKSVENAFDKYEKEFMSYLTGSGENRLFQQDYSRSLDRALWSYGHLFNDNKRNQSRKITE